MKKLLLTLALCLATLTPVWGNGVLILAQSSGGGTPVNHIALDGTSARSDATSTSATPTLTTTQAGDFIVVAVTQNSAHVSGISDTAGLTWTRRSGTVNNTEMWWAVAPTALSGDVITVTFLSSTFHTTIAFGLSGVAASSQFDSNVSLPSSSSTATTTFSTS